MPLSPTRVTEPDIIRAVKYIALGNNDISAYHTNKLLVSFGGTLTQAEYDYIVSVYEAVKAANPGEAGLDDLILAQMQSEAEE